MDDILLKHKHIYIFYRLLLKYKGEDAKYITKSKLYGDVADFFYVKDLMVSRVIHTLEKKGYTPNVWDLQYFHDNVKRLNEITNKRREQEA